MEGIGLKTLFKRDRHCYYCRVETELTTSAEQKLNTATVEHKIPRSRGGSNSPNNKVLACYRCNSDKMHLTEEEYRAVLQVRANQKPYEAELGR